AGLIVPIISLHASRGEHDQFQSALQKGFDFMVTVSFPIIAGVFVLAHPIMTLIAGAAFTSSGSILRVLIFAVGTIFLGTLFGYTVVAVNQQKRMMKYYLGVAIFSLLGYFLLIPHYSVWGAAGMTVATELSITISSFLVIRKASHASLSLRQTAKALCASIALAAAVFPLRHQSLLLGVAVGMISYAVFLAVFGGLRRDLIREMIRRQ
ncbi:MAG: polysaccharide biosynthesis C-terminal domain-containing protein, partial [bacterium]